MRRSNLMVLLGAAFFVLGGAIVLLVLQDDGTPKAGAAEGGASSTVVVATEAIPPGALGDDLIAAGKLETREFAVDQRPADALSSPSEVSGRIFQAAFAEGEPLRAGGLRPASMRQGAGVEIPEGMEAVAVQVDFVAGAAGYVAPGDMVNVWSVIEKTTPLDGGNQAAGPGFNVPRTDLLLSNVEVLDVSSEVAPRRAAEDPTTPRPAGDPLTYLLAVDTASASRAIFATSFGEIYLTLVREDAQPASVPGVEYSSILR